MKANLASLQTAARTNNARRPFGFSDPVRWIEREFYIPERRNEPVPAMLLAPYQKAVLREAYRLHPETGKFVYDVVCWSDIKKSIKSSIAAAVILHRALETEWGSFKVVANDLKQADSRVFYYLSRAATLNPRLSARITTRNYRISLDNHSAIEAIPVDPKGEAGGNDDLIEWTELHAANGKAAHAMWSEMTLSPTKHGYSQRWIDTYAGRRGESETLEQIYDTAVKPERRLDLSYTEDGVFYDLSDLEVYAVGGLLVLWNGTPRLSWQTPAYYASELQILHPAEFARMHRNVWGSSQSQFVPIEWWDACATPPEPLTPYQSCVAALDAGVTNDCFALVVVSRNGERVELRYSKVWTPDGHTPINFGEVETHLRDIAARFPIVEWAFDPYQLVDMTQRARRDGLGNFRAFSQGADRLEADKQLYDLIRDRRIAHDGTHETVRQHVANADVKNVDDKSLRIVKRSEKQKIDACVALSMASARALHLNIG